MEGIDRHGMDQQEGVTPELDTGMVVVWAVMKVPIGAKPGETCRFNTQHGPLDIIMPEGIQPGGSMKFQYAVP
jgi:hypothetical protein